MSIDCTKENWLAKIAEDSGPSGYVHLYPIGRLDVKTVQETADAQYGKGRFRFYDHGTVIYGYDGPKARAYRD